KKGCLFDQWKERLNFASWQETFAELNLDPDFYFRERRIDEILPWELLNSSAPKEYLEKEYHASRETVNQSPAISHQPSVISQQLSISPIKSKPKNAPRAVQRVRLCF
ncbi:MAG TPA: hypothetical protein DHV62_06720, partial [Elusimicrobia bacterium]|nr:hypothetical protein [Elusimicrobiota bacterium]